MRAFFTYLTIREFLFCEGGEEGKHISFRGILMMIIHNTNDPRIAVLPRSALIVSVNGYFRISHMEFHTVPSGLDWLERHHTHLETTESTSLDALET